MSLRRDIENAFLKTMEYDNIEDRDARKKMKEKAEDLGTDISRAIVDFLQKQELTITKMKAIVKLDELTTTGPLSANIRSSVQTMIPAGIFATTALIPNPPVPVPVSGITAKNGVDIPKLKLKTGGGQGGSMNAVGYAYVGKKNPVSPNESNEDKTIVQLLDVVDD